MTTRTSNTHKRRSRSESRKLEPLDRTAYMYGSRNVEWTSQKLATGARRKTSAELISEAKNLLAHSTSPIIGGGGGAATATTMTTSGQIASGGHVGGLRLVSTRRPITPRETGRALYGKVALAGRPPSAFSLRYLQNEGNRTPLTPALEPIKSRVSAAAAASIELAGDVGSGGSGSSTAAEQHFQKSIARRSHSLDARMECYENEAGNNVAASAKMKIPRKLPALPPAKAAVRPASAVVTNAANTRTTRKSLARNCDLLSQSSTETLIELLKEHAGLKDCNAETVSHIYAILNELQLRVRHNQKQFKRGFILGGLYGLVECSSPQLLLAVARVVLALRVSGSNLTGACKLVFKVARNEQNDALFHDNELLELLIDGLGRASPLDDPEACIYGYGAVRFLTASTAQERAETAALREINKNWKTAVLPPKPATAPPQAAAAAHDNKLLEQQTERFKKLHKQNTLVERLARHGAVELMVLHLQMLNEAGATQPLMGPPLHSLYQLSAALRALADVRQTHASSSSSPTALEGGDAVVAVTPLQLSLACPQLVRAAEISIGELEVQANIVRTLSVLSEDVACCDVIVNYTARIGMLLGSCCENVAGDDEGAGAEKLLPLLSRLGYVLGNIMAKYDNARVQFYHNDVALQSLLHVLQLYAQQPLTLHNHMGDSVIDVLIKMIRVVANMSVNAEVGFGLGNTCALGGILLQLLLATTNEATKNVKMRTEIHELTQATLGALHNLCFYQDTNSTPAQVLNSKGTLQSVLTQLSMSLCATLQSTTHADTKVETARVLGNLTRNGAARRALCQADGLSTLVRQLHKCALAAPGQLEYELKACAIGVLVNLLGDSDNRAPFMQLHGGLLLLKLLRVALQQEDWFVGAITCQAFWNLLIDGGQNVLALFETHILDDMCELLADYLDEESLFVGDAAPDALWEEFAVVATDLLERIQHSYEQRMGGASDAENNNERQAMDREEENDEDDVYIDEM